VTDQGGVRTPIVAVTANVMAHQVELYNASGMDGFIAKSIHVRFLSACLTKFLSDAEEPPTARLGS